MALSYRLGNRGQHDHSNGSRVRTLSPFDDPDDPQFGIVPNGVGPIVGTPRRPQPPDSDRGTARELRRRYSLRGSFNRTNSAPPRPQHEDVEQPRPQIRDAEPMPEAFMETVAAYVASLPSSQPAGEPTPPAPSPPMLDTDMDT